MELLSSERAKRGLKKIKAEVRKAKYESEKSEKRKGKVQ